MRIYIVYIMSKRHKTVFRANIQTLEKAKMQEAYSENKLTKLKTNTFQWIILCNSVKHNNLDYKYNLLLVISFQMWWNIWLEKLLSKLHKLQ